MPIRRSYDIALRDAAESRPEKQGLRYGSDTRLREMHREPGQQWLATSNGFLQQWLMRCTRDPETSERSENHPFNFS
jgi:hypothetical protein